MLVDCSVAVVEEGQLESLDTRDQEYTVMKYQSIDVQNELCSLHTGAQGQTTKPLNYYGAR